MGMMASIIAPGRPAEFQLFRPLNLSSPCSIRQRLSVLAITAM